MKNIIINVQDVSTVWLKASTGVMLLSKGFLVLAWCHFIVRNRFGTTGLSHIQGLEVIQEPLYNSMNNFKIAQMCLDLVRLCAVSMYHDRDKGKDKGEVHPII